MMTWLHLPNSKEKEAKAAAVQMQAVPSPPKAPRQQQEPAPLEIIRGDPHTAYRFHRVVGQGHYGKRRAGGATAPCRDSCNGRGTATAQAHCGTTWLSRR